jgi:hypothetical protein
VDEDRRAQWDLGQDVGHVVRNPDAPVRDSPADAARVVGAMDPYLRVGTGELAEPVRMRGQAECECPVRPASILEKISSSSPGPWPCWPPHLVLSRRTADRPPRRVPTPVAAPDPPAWRCQEAGTRHTRNVPDQGVVTGQLALTPSAAGLPDRDVRGAATPTDAVGATFTASVPVGHRSETQQACQPPGALESAAHRRPNPDGCPPQHLTGPAYAPTS